MYQTVSESDFAQSMKQFADWPYDASVAFFNYLEDTFADEPGIELDPIGFRCDYAVYDSFEEYVEDTGHEIDSLEELGHNTTVVEVGDGSIVVRGW